VVPSAVPGLGSVVEVEAVNVGDYTGHDGCSFALTMTWGIVGLSTPG
jgi:hypothetical protein